MKCEFSWIYPRLCERVSAGYVQSPQQPPENDDYDNDPHSASTVGTSDFHA